MNNQQKVVGLKFITSLDLIYVRDVLLHSFHPINEDQWPHPGEQPKDVPSVLTTVKSESTNAPLRRPL